MERKITVPTGYVRNLLSQAEAQGFDTGDLLERVGISPHEIEQKTEFPADKFGMLYQRVMYIAQDEYFGMLSGGKVPNGTFRIMCHAIIHCKTLEKAIYRASDFHEICRGAQVKPMLVRKGRFAKVSFAPTDSAEIDFDQFLRNEPPSRIRTSLSMWHHFVSWLLGTRLELKAAYFTFGRPDDVDHYRMLFQSEVKFDQHDNAFVFPSRYLDYPIVQTEQSLRSFLKTAPYQLIAMVNDDKSLKAQVVALIGKDFSRELPGAEEVATTLNLSVSTLRRRLLEEGTSYQKIKDECRREAALNYMNSVQLSINDVAGLMGFDEPSAFFRSFKKWTGLTPGEYRRSEAYRKQLEGSSAPCEVS
ncbi:AraC family transcriptional regulator [Marinobacterium arenosum]|uniref:AraC family transcriptional regulator n=1 Tax=Marinobacterium arenosum TaxID=2862496 RepID=UPI001C9452F3|nr:AraC family transcriptional regulator [Marinobacterium arenosum]MBY4677482.1 AraC family transcriptional regulator [Marinobacterium arenosum]